MRLISARVTNFRNVVDSEEIVIDPEVTCLVGKNESGKTALLSALYRVNPVHEATTFDAAKDYPRWKLSKDRRDQLVDSAIPVSAIFAIEKADEAAVAKVFGDGVLLSDTIGLQRNYAGEVTYTLRVDPTRATQNLFATLETPATLQAKFAENLLMGTVSLEASKLTRTEDDEWATEDLTSLRAELGLRLGGQNTMGAVATLLAARLPKFFYFADYQSLPGRIDINKLQGEETPGETDMQTARALLKLASTDAASLTGEDFEDRKAELETVSNEITEEVLTFWKQNQDLSIQIDIDKVTVPNQDGYRGTTAVAKYLDIRVRDARHGFTNNFDQRLSGFRWFFSFLAAFSEFRDYEHGVVVLLDEPALTLHGRAQADFLNYIDERLAASTQVIFTTHSPFMVNPTKLDRVRIIEDRGAKLGSVATQEAMAVGADSLFPLQAALGYDIAQNLFIGPNNLVVEGTSDYTYLWLLSERLTALKREGLNEAWRVLPAGGAANIPSFVALMGQGLDVTTLIDGGPSAQTKLHNLADRGLMQKKRIFVTDQFTDGISPSDIEDLFDPKDYLHLYNLAFGAKLTKTTAPGTDRIIARISRSVGSQFVDHGAPADYLLRHRQVQLPRLSDITLERFENLFKAINKTLA